MSSADVDDVLDLDATGQAERVRDGSVHPRELVDASIARVEAQNGRLNAVIHKQYEKARLQADADVPSAPFAGVPFLLKDFGAQEVGEPHWAGLGAARDVDYRARTDSVVAEAFRRAGFITIGRTNTPELACKGTTEPVALGPSHNPWNVSRTPGGSSGGAGAAVAARLVAAAHANDIAGSIRIPASHCGLVGLKASRWRFIADNVPPPIGMFTEGALVRSVRDAAGLADALLAKTENAWWAPSSGDAPLTDAVGVTPPKLRIGFTTRPFNGADIETECAATATRAAALLESLGHEVEAAAPDALLETAFHEAMQIAMVVSIDSDARAWSKRLGRELGEVDLEPDTWSAIVAARELEAVDLYNAVAEIEAASRRSSTWWTHDGFDLLVTPTTAQGPTELGKLQYVRGGLSAFTRVFNATGHPTISLPLGWPDDGLPRGAQLIAAHGREDLLISVAARLEEAQPWADHRPKP